MLKFYAFCVKRAFGYSKGQDILLLKDLHSMAHLYLFGYCRNFII
jgi:hypothetical protein